MNTLCLPPSGRRRAADIFRCLLRRRHAAFHTLCLLMSLLSASEDRLTPFSPAASCRLAPRH